MLFLITRYGPFLDMPITIASESNRVLVFRPDVDLRSACFVVHTVPYGAVSYDVRVDVFLNDFCRLRYRSDV